MIRRTCVASGLVLGLSLLTCGPLLAEEKASSPAGSPPRPMEQMKERMQQNAEHFRQSLQELDLTDDQKAQVRSIMEETQKERQAFRQAHEQELKDLRQQIDAARQAKDHETAKELHAQVKAIMDQAPKPKDTMEKVKTVLTDEQKARLDQKIKEHQETMKQRRQEMGADGPRGPREMNDRPGREDRQERREGKRRMPPPPPADGDGATPPPPPPAPEN